MVRSFWEQVQHVPRVEWRKDPSKASMQLALITDRIRGLLDVPFQIHICWDDSGHVENSLHYVQDSGFAEAVDGHFWDRGQTYLQELLAILSFPEIGGVGFYPHWNPRPGWHLDIRKDVPRLFWVRFDGEYSYGIEQMAKAVWKEDMDLRLQRKHKQEV